MITEPQRLVEAVDAVTKKKLNLDEAVHWCPGVMRSVRLIRKIRRIRVRQLQFAFLSAPQHAQRFSASRQLQVTIISVPAVAVAVREPPATGRLLRPHTRKRIHPRGTHRRHNTCQHHHCELTNCNQRVSREINRLDAV